MTRLVFETVSTATAPCPPDYQNTFVNHNGRKYQAVGASEGNPPSFGKRLAHTIALIGMIFIAIVTAGAALMFKGFRAQISQNYTIAKNTKDEFIHYVPRQPLEWEKAITSPESGIIKNLQDACSGFGLRNHLGSILAGLTFCLKFNFKNQHVEKQFFVRTNNIREIGDINTKLIEMFDQEVDQPHEFVDAESLILCHINNSAVPQRASVKMVWIAGQFNVLTKKDCDVIAFMKSNGFDSIMMPGQPATLKEYYNKFAHGAELEDHPELDS